MLSRTISASWLIDPMCSVLTCERCRCEFQRGILVARREQVRRLHLLDKFLWGRPWSSKGGSIRSLRLKVVLMSP